MPARSAVASIAAFISVEEDAASAPGATASSVSSDGVLCSGASKDGVPGFGGSAALAGAARDKSRWCSQRRLNRELCCN